MATWSADASRMSFSCQRIARGPGPSPANVPSITANKPLWISCWIANRSTTVSWITPWVQWRFSLSRPPNAFFIAPVITVKTWVFTVGRWMMFLSKKYSGMQDALGEDPVQHQHGRLGHVAHPANLGLVQVHVAQTVGVHHVLLLVVLLADVSVHHDRLVVRGGEIAYSRPPGASVTTPSICQGVAGAGRIPGLPGDVDLQDRFVVFGQRLLVARPGPSAGR